MSTSLIGIGANLGDRAQTIRTAVRQLSEHDAISAVRVSQFCETAAIGGPSPQPNFLNAAVRLDTSLDPSALFDLLQAIEHQCGRQRDEHWAARTLDLDLLLYDNEVIADQRLTVPHPRMTFRRFVLQPAAEVAADLVHPRMGWTVGNLLAHLDTTPWYLAITGSERQLCEQLADEVAATLDARRLPDPARIPMGLDAGGGTVTALESVQAQARSLALASWPASTQLTVSDFWFDGWSLSVGPGASGQVVREAWQSLRGDVVAPRLTVLIEAGMKGDGREPGWAQQLRQYAERPALGPLLVVPADDWPRALSETVAACQAMY